MGFTPEENHYKLTFESPAYAGLEVTVREISVGELTELAELVSEVKSSDSLKAAAKIGRLFDVLGESLVSWNITARDGSEVAATPEGVRTQTLKTVLAIVQPWIAVMAEVEAPLASGSSGGETSLELSIPMEPSSPSPGS